MARAHFSHLFSQLPVTITRYNKPIGVISRPNHEVKKGEKIKHEKSKEK